MSVLRQLNVLGNMRIDVPHIRSIESSIAADFDVVVGRATAGDKPLIIRGFVLANASVGNSPTDAQLITADSIVYNLSASESGSFLWTPKDRTPETLNASNGKVNGSFTANTVNYVGIDFKRTADASTTDLVQFLDSNTLLESGRTIPLGRTLDYVITISTSPFSTTSNIVPVAKITTDINNTITATQDARTLMYRLGAGGDFPNGQFTYTFPFGRQEDSSNAVFSGGDKNIQSEKDWKNAIMTRIWELGGGANWYSPTADRNVRLIRKPSFQFSNGDNFILISGAQLHWQGLVMLFDNANTAGVYYNEIQDQTVDDTGPDNKTLLAVGECLYIDVDRTQNLSGANAIVAKKASLQNLGTPVVPGSRYIIAWRDNETTGTKIFTRDFGYPVGQTFSNATTTTFGIVEIARAANLGLPVAITTTGGDIVAIAGNGANQNGLTAIGLGTGAGLRGTGGTTNGIGVLGRGTGAGPGISGVGGTTGIGGDFAGGSSSSVPGVKGTGGNTTGDSNGVEGYGGPTGGGNGVYGQGSAVGDYYGIQGLGTGNRAGVFGIGGSNSIAGVYGQNPNTGTVYGTYGQILSAVSLGADAAGVGGSGGNAGHGVFGIGGSFTGSGSGVKGRGGFPNGVGVQGSGSGSGIGGSFSGGPSSGFGVYGAATGGNAVGVSGQGFGSGSGVAGLGGATGPGGFFTAGGGNTIGVSATGSGTEAGLSATGGGGTLGVYGVGVFGRGGGGSGGSGNGVAGEAQGSGAGVVGTSLGSGIGVLGTGAVVGAGVKGVGGGGGGPGVFGVGGAQGVFGQGGGALGTGNHVGVEGLGTGNAAGVSGTGGNQTTGDGGAGIFGRNGLGSTGKGYGVVGEKVGAGGGAGGLFYSTTSGGAGLEVGDGNLVITGTAPAYNAVQQNMLHSQILPRGFACIRWGSVGPTFGLDTTSSMGITSVSSPGTGLIDTILSSATTGTVAIAGTAGSGNWTVLTQAAGTNRIKIIDDTGAAVNFTTTNGFVTLIFFARVP